MAGSKAQIAQEKRAQTAQEKKWQAQDDAHTLAAANAIASDPARSKRAGVAASQMVKEQKTRLAGLEKVATKAKAPVRKR